MSNIALSTDAEINGTTYQIGRMTARDGSWVLMQVLTKILPVVLPNAFSSMLPEGRVSIGEDDFAAVQSICLSVCRYYHNGAPMPIFARPNKWLAPEYEYDLTVVMGLTVKAIIFSLSDFFSGGGLNGLLNSLPQAPPSPDSQP